MIIYFSGTGNSKYVANRIAKDLNEKLISFKDVCGKKEIEVNDNLIIVTPTYAWKIPKVLEKFLIEDNLKNVKSIRFIMTCGGEMGDSFEYNGKLAKKRGWDYLGTYEIKMPDNYIIMFNPVTSDEAKDLLTLADEKIERILEIIKSGKSFEKEKVTFKDLFNTHVINGVFYKVFVSSKGFYTKDNCIACGKCVDVCPLSNIQLKDKKVSWGDNCTQCMSCITYCKEGAIEYKGKTENKYKYKIEDYRQ